MNTKQMKKCSKCREVKGVGEYYKNRAKKDGLTHYCKTCLAGCAKLRESWYAKYRTSDKAKEAKTRYARSEKGRAQRSKTNKSEKHLSYMRERDLRQRAALTDEYIVSLMANHSKIPHKVFYANPGLIEAKREIIKIKRQITNLN